MLLLALLTAVRADPVETPLAPAAGVVWVGRLAVHAERHIPLVGQVTFRTDTFVLADVVGTEDGWRLEQRVCRVEFSKAAGAQVSLDPTGPAGMPKVNVFFRADGDQFRGSWASGWDEADHDRDGEPGITFHVAAPICSGSLFFRSAAQNAAVGRPQPGLALTGELAVDVRQEVLGARGACLRLFTRNRDDHFTGRFAYQEAPVGTTCASVTTWPDPLLEDPRG